LSEFLGYVTAIPQQITIKATRRRNIVRLTVNAFVGLDGTMQGPAGPEEYDNPFPPERGGWLVPFSDQLGGVLDTDWFARADAMLLGRTTYQIMRPHWSQITDSNDPVAAVLNNHRKYVVSTTLTPETATWANTGQRPHVRAGGPN
jgi:dihydrofolate reductase